MASAQQLIGLIKSHAEGDEDRFFDLAMQLAAAEAQKGPQAVGRTTPTVGRGQQDSIQQGKPL